MGDHNILQSKLFPPKPSANYMRRAPFIKKAQACEQVKLTLVHSGAGYGKSSSLAAFFQDSRLLHSWYTITEEDDGLLPFVTYLRHSIRRIIPHFGQTIDETQLFSTFPKEEDLKHWITLFINELCTIAEPFFIVLDDFHHIDHDFHIQYVLEKVLDQLPPHIHVIIATRTRPKWNILLKLKLAAQLCEITSKEMLFSEQELVVFYEDYFLKQLTRDEAKQIITVTEGWAIAIGLLAHHLTTTDLPLTDAINPAFHELFSYLSEEVFLRLTEEQRQWLCAFSLFPIFDEQLIREFYGSDAANRLIQFVETLTFIQKIGEDDTFRYHALFQQFLEEKWRQSDILSYEALQKKAAQFYRNNASPSQALYHAMKSKDVQFIARMVASTGEALIQSGQFEWLLDTLKEIPEKVRDAHYSLYYFEGEAQRYRAYYEKARNAYEKCLLLANKRQDFLYCSLAHAGLANIYLDTIQPSKAAPHLREAIYFSEQSDKMKPIEKNRLKRQFAENLLNLGYAMDAKLWIVEQQMEAALLQEGNLDARIALRTGNFVLAETILTSRQHAQSNVPNAHRETEVLLSLLYAFIGNGEDAKKHARNSIQQGIEEQLNYVEAVGWIRLGHASLLNDPQAVGEAEQSYLKAVMKMEAVNVSRGKAEPLMGLMLAKAHQQLYAEALEYGQAALRETEIVQDDWLSGLIRLGLAITYYYARDFENSIIECVKAQSLLQQCGDCYGEMTTYFWLTVNYAKTDEEEKFLRSAEHFARLCNRYPYHFFLTQKTLFSPFDIQILYPLAQQLQKIGSENEEIEALIQKINFEPNTTYPGYSLHIQLLGNFQVYIHFQPLSSRIWQRDKSKELFVYLLLNRHRFVPKEEMLQALWRGQEGGVADRDFKVTLNALLKVLEPHRKARQNAFFIIRNQSMYRINPEAEITVDIEQFKTIAQTGFTEKNVQYAEALLEKAASLYKGQLLEEKLEIEWLAYDRRQIEQMYMRVMEQLAQLSIEQQHYHQAIYWAEKLLRFETTWEEAYRLLMLANYRLNNRPNAIKWYEICKEVLHEELTIEPMEATRQLYEAIYFEQS